MKKQAKATKPATKQQTRKQKQAKEQERNETIQERVERVAQSRQFYEQLIEEGHEILLEQVFFWEGRAA